MSACTHGRFSKNVASIFHNAPPKYRGTSEISEAISTTVRLSVVDLYGCNILCSGDRTDTACLNRAVPLAEASEVNHDDDVEKANLGLRDLHNAFGPALLD